MGKRREGRMAAVQYLFANDLQKKEDSTETRESFWTLHSGKGRVKEFAEELVTGVLNEREVLDAHIADLLENFSFSRLAVVDRNVMRLAAYELIHNPDLPAPVIINEAIEIAKMLGAGESGSFVNGVLHRLAGRLRPRTPSPSTPPPVTEA